MSYCTEQDLITRYGASELIQLTDKENVGQMDSDVIAVAIADADSLIDGYLGGKFSLPIVPVPLSLVRIACEITRFYLHEDGAMEEVKDRYEKAEKILEKMAAGKINIGITEQGEKPASQNTVVMKSGGNVFNRNDKGFM